MEILKSYRYKITVLTLFNINMLCALGLWIAYDRLNILSIELVKGLTILFSSYTTMGLSVTSFADDKYEGRFQLLSICPIPRYLFIVGKIAGSLCVVIPLFSVPYGILLYIITNSFNILTIIIFLAIITSILCSTIGFLVLMLTRQHTGIGILLVFTLTFIIVAPPQIDIYNSILIIWPGYVIRNTLLNIGEDFLKVILYILVQVIYTMIFVYIASKLIEREDAILP